MPFPYTTMPSPVKRSIYSLAPPDAPPVQDSGPSQLYSSAPQQTSPQVSLSQDPANGMQADLGAKLMAALQPRQVGTGRRVLAGIGGALGGPEVAEAITGKLGQQRDIANLGQQFSLAGQIAQQNRQQQLENSTLGLQQAQIGNLNSETQARLNPPIKVGTTPEETALHDLMTGNNGQPRINPDTGKPYQYLEAFNDVNVAKAGGAKSDKPGEYKPYTVPGAAAPMLATQIGSKLMDRTGKELPANAIPFEKPPEAQKPDAEDKAVNDHLAAQGLPNTPANRDQARMDLVTGKASALSDAKSAANKQQLKQSSDSALSNMQNLSKLNTDAANYAFLMNFIGTSYEGIRGARLNRAEIERAAQTRTLPDTLQNAYDLYVNKKILTPTQKNEMLQTTQALNKTYSEPDTPSSGADTTDQFAQFGGKKR